MSHQVLPRRRRATRRVLATVHAPAALTRGAKPTRSPPCSDACESEGPPSPGTRHDRSSLLSFPYPHGGPGLPGPAAAAPPPAGWQGSEAKSTPAGHTAGTPGRQLRTQALLCRPGSQGGGLGSGGSRGARGGEAPGSGLGAGPRGKPVNKEVWEMRLEPAASTPGRRWGRLAAGAQVWELPRAQPRALLLAAPFLFHAFSRPVVRRTQVTALRRARGQRSSVLFRCFAHRCRRVC